MAANGVSDASSDPATALAGLLHERAEVFANPALDAGNVSGSGEASTSRSVHRETLRATKYLFDNGKSVTSWESTCRRILDIA